MIRNKYSAKFKFDRVIESIQTDSVSQIARKYGFGANLLSKWRSEFLKGGQVFFETQPDKDLVKLKKKITQLEQLLGKKEVELNLISNFSDFYQSQGGR